MIEALGVSPQTLGWFLRAFVTFVVVCLFYVWMEGREGK